MLKIFSGRGFGEEERCGRGGGVYLFVGLEGWGRENVRGKDV